MTIEQDSTKRGAPATGCFGLARPIESYGEDARQHPEGTPSSWVHHTSRFCLIDYGDGQPVREAPQTS